ncbi:MAG: FkbM family methyltransferase [Planctomycetaceae bacterium]
MMTDQQARLTKHSDLIYDIGMHLGKDTDFYLQKGFRVVAVEASPDHISRASQQFQKPIADGRLTLVPAAIAPAPGKIQFFRNLDKDDWGTISREFAARNEQLGTRSESVEVDAVTLPSLLAQHGVPYYMKIDIEGADTLCLEALHDFPERPRFVSIEIDLISFADGFDSIVHLWNLGYRDFKLVNQSLNKKAVCPNPPLEGKYVPARFDAHTSGPFGEESPGTWLNVEMLLQRYHRIMKQQKRFGASGRYYHSPLRHLSKWSRRLLGMEPIGWYDLHARFSETAVTPD